MVGTVTRDHQEPTLQELGIGLGCVGYRIMARKRSRNGSRYPLPAVIGVGLVVLCCLIVGVVLAIRSGAGGRQTSNSGSVQAGPEALAPQGRPLGAAP